MEIDLRKISIDEFNSIKDEIILEYENNKVNYVNFTYYSEDLNGIFCDGILVGLFRIGMYINNISIDLIIRKNYRRKSIALNAIKKIVINYGKLYPNVKYFIGNVNPANIASNKLCEKLNWEKDYSYNDIMLEEGGEFFNIYTLKNPSYKK